MHFLHSAAQVILAKWRKPISRIRSALVKSEFRIAERDFGTIEKLSFANTKFAVPLVTEFAFVRVQILQQLIVRRVVQTFGASLPIAGRWGSSAAASQIDILERIGIVAFIHQQVELKLSRNRNSEKVKIAVVVNIGNRNSII